MQLNDQQLQFQSYSEFYRLHLKKVESIQNNPLAYVLKGKQGSYTVGSDTINFGPGKFEHTGYQLRGALPKMSTPTVYLTGITPFKHTIQIG